MSGLGVLSIRSVFVSSFGRSYIGMLGGSGGTNPNTNQLKWKKPACGSKKSQAFKKQRAHEQPIAKDRVIHTNKSAYATTLLKVENLKHSAPAYTGNLTRQDEVSLPPELGCGYRRLKYIAG